MDSEDSEKGKIRNFPKPKRQTPDDIGCVPMMHMCLSEDMGGSVFNFKWLIHLNGAGLHFICNNCGTSLTLEEIMNAYEEDE